MSGLVVVLAWPVLAIGVAIGLDWRAHQVAPRFGKPARCEVCGKPAVMKDESGRPCHKVCAEREMGYRP